MPKKVKTFFLFRQFPKLKNKGHNNEGLPFTTYRLKANTRIFMAPALVLPECPQFAVLCSKEESLRAHEPKDQPKRFPRKCKSNPGAVNVKEVCRSKESSIPDVKNKKKETKRNRKRKASLSPIEKADNLLRCSACERSFDSENRLIIHESKVCFQKLTPDRNANSEQMKECFMNQFGMKPVAKADSSSDSAFAHSGNEEVEVGEDVCDAHAPSRKTRASTHNLAAFFRKNYIIPLSGARGQRLIRQSENGFLSNPEEAAKFVDKVLGQKTTKTRKSRRILKSRVAPKVKPNVNEHAYAHSYQFSKKDKIQRQTELVIGLKTRHFKLLNQCKEAKIKLTKLSPEEIKKWACKEELPSGTLPKTYRCIVKPCKVKLTDLAHSVTGRTHLQKALRVKRAAKRRAAKT